MPTPKPLRVAALVDLPRSAEAGGHVKCWEWIARAAGEVQLPLDLTVYFSGSATDEILGLHTRLRHLKPVFSTERLKFLPYMPATADLAPWHSQLARELTQYNVIHTTDGFFAFAQTAAKVSQKNGIALTTSFHTDTPAYARIFTRQTIEKLGAGAPALQRLLTEKWNLPEKQGRSMERKLIKHIRACRYAFATRPEDHMLAENILGAARVKPLCLGIDKTMFGTHRADRAGVLRDYDIGTDRTVALFVGRVDIGKNIYTLIEAAEKLAVKGVPLHLIIAGIGPAIDEVRQRLGRYASLPGYVKPQELARLYASVDLLTIVSEVEIRSMAGGEALISGCPVLVSEKSGIAPLFNDTPAMQVVEGSVDSWVAALSDFVAGAGKRELMRVAAVNYGEHFLVSWHEVLARDLLPVWHMAAEDMCRQAA
jgi:glycosyltransferase involved in cell wall biosynthesis